jgi:hypothetical protein
MDCFVALLLATTPLDTLDSFAVFRFLLAFGTFLPLARASDNPIAIACLRLLTFLPERPLFKVPALRFFIARSTSAEAFLEYLRAMDRLPVAGNQSVRFGKVPKLVAIRRPR